MRPINIVYGEVVRISEAQIYVGLSCEMEDCVDFMSGEALHHVYRIRHISVNELKIRGITEHPCVV